MTDLVSPPPASGRAQRIQSMLRQNVADATAIMRQGAVELQRDITPDEAVAIAFDEVPMAERPAPMAGIY